MTDLCKATAAAMGTTECPCEAWIDKLLTGTGDDWCDGRRETLRLAYHAAFTAGRWSEPYKPISTDLLAPLVAGGWIAASEESE